MSVTGWWIVMAVPGSVVAEVRPRLGPLIEGQAAAGQGGFERWRRGELDLRCVPEQYDLAAPDLLDEHLDLLYEVWNAHAESGPSLAASCRKGYPAVGLAHALGPERFAALPGWFGHFVLSPGRVRDTLPGVAAALSLDPAQRAAAEQRLRAVLDEVQDADAAALLDGLVPVWQRARDAGWGVIGAQATPS
ncbi:hypothetical protein HUT16_36725 [Kitasatospora sp. NA04385]|uniref:hypothetical protein n=1 Tax=Kitasatospora sp. NA04385 TaxID=2742135 RepID=UPI001590C2AB|nr:hypothetical protein [Kitasatospora sp. NA04385]QKW23915.1 hypothetical protein HUT16_36725 [Kitasatospora sp. NA04385]